MKSDYKQRELILKAFYLDKDYIGGVKHFTHLPLEILELLVIEGHAQPEERQNDAPSIRELLTFSKQMKDKGYTFTFSGYTTSKERDDYRVSIDAVDIKYYFDNDNHINNRIIRKFFEHADEKYEDTNYFRFWYD